LDEMTTPNACVMACEWPLKETWEEGGQAQAGHSEVEEWGGGENRAEVGCHLQEDGLYCSCGVLQFDVRGI